MESMLRNQVLRAGGKEVLGDLCIHFRKPLTHFLVLILILQWSEPNDPNK